MAFENVKIAPDSFPRVVINLQDKEGKSLMWKAFVPNGTNGGVLDFKTTNLVNIRQIIDIKRYLPSGEGLLKIYLWNNKAAGMTFRRFNIDIEAE